MEGYLICAGIIVFIFVLVLCNISKKENEESRKYNMMDLIKHFPNYILMVDLSTMADISIKYEDYLKNNKFERILSYFLVKKEYEKCFTDFHKIYINDYINTYRQGHV